MTALRAVAEPATGRGLVELRPIPGVTITGQDVHLTIELLSPIQTTRDKIERNVAPPSAPSVAPPEVSHRRSLPKREHD